MIKNNKSQRALAIQDLKDSLSRYRLWLHLGWADIQQRYRGSFLGPFWITLSMMIFIGALGVVYSRLFHQELSAFLPFLATGMLSWIMVSTMLMESTDVFIQAKSLIDNIKLPFFIYIFRLLWRHQIIFFHNLVVFVLVAIFFKVKINANILYFIPAFLLVSALLVFTSIIVALIGTRFRDVPPVISSLIMVVFFVSPVTWQAEMLGKQSYIIKLNPVYYLLDLLRSPLLGKAPEPSSWGICLLLTLGLFLISFSLFTRFRSRIPFWV